MQPLIAPLDTSADAYPAESAPLEEISASRPHDRAASFAFALSRLPAADQRPILVAAPRWRLSEYGRPFAQGVRRYKDRLILIAAKHEQDALWAQEQALRSGAVAAAFALAESVSLAATRRLDFAAKEGKCTAFLLRTDPGGLSAARRRWRIASTASQANPFNPKAPGALRMRAELLRRRDGPPGAWLLEQDDETGRLHVADRLADHGLVESGGAIAA
jgi:protein ImuA